MPHLNSFFVLVWNQRTNLMFFMQHSCLIHVDQLSLSRAAAKENVLHLKNELLKEPPQTAGFSYPTWISPVQWRCWRHKGCLNTRIFSRSSSVFLDVWSMTADVLESLRTDGCCEVMGCSWWKPSHLLPLTSQDVALLTAPFQSGQLRRPYGAEKHSFSSKEILKPSSV